MWRHGQDIIGFVIVCMGRTEEGWTAPPGLGWADRGGMRMPGAMFGINILGWWCTTLALVPRDGRYICRAATAAPGVVL